MLPVAQNILRNLTALVPLFEESPTATPVVPTPTPVAAATPVPALPTPVTTPVPSPWMPAQWLQTTGWANDFHGVFLALYLLVAVAAIVAYVYLFQRRFKGHALNARLAERASINLTVFATVGLLLLFFAVARIGLLGWPLLLILSLVALIAAGVYAIYYYVNLYPTELAKYTRQQARERYIPKGKTKGPAQTPPMKKKAKKK